MLATRARSSLLLCGLAAALIPGCRPRGSETAPAPIRLVDLYKPDPAVNTNAPGVSLPPPVEWRFVSIPAPSSGPSGTPPAWTAGPGVQGLTVRDGHLVGRATSDLPVIDLERPPSEDRDVVHEVQVRMRASAGANLSVALRPTEKVDLKAEADLAPI
ncbi:MAG: hypothetical protein DMF77_25095, partial [Acidobacteria bacterium]